MPVLINGYLTIKRCKLAHNKEGLKNEHEAPSNKGTNVAQSLLNILILLRVLMEKEQAEHSIIKTSAPALNFGICKMIELQKKRSVEEGFDSIILVFLSMYACRLLCRPV